MNMKEAVKEFYFQCRQSHSELTARIYRDILEQFPSQNLDLSAIKPILIMKHLAQFENLGPSTRNLKTAAFRSFFKWAEEAGLITKSPCRSLRAEPVPHREPRYLTRKEVKQLLGQIKNVRDLCMVEIFLRTGLRLSELSTLTVGQAKAGRVLIIGKRQKQREIFLPHIPTVLVKNRPDDSPLFKSALGGRLSIVQIQNLASQYLKRAGIKGASVHTLRHTFATAVYQKTRDLRLVQELLGHSSPMTTQIYTHVNEQAKRQAVRGLYERR